MDPFEEASETDVSDDEHSNDEEPRRKDVLGNLSKTVSRKRASELLHSMAASKDNLSCFGHLADSYSETKE